MTTYAILKHKLLDIDIVIKKSLVYSILIFTISVIYITIVLLSERFLQGFLGYKSVFVSILAAFFLGAILFPLRNRIQNVVDRYIFQKTPEEIAEENKLLRQEVMKMERLRTIATLASGMAHELKNPLTALKTFTEYLPSKSNNQEFLDKFTRIVSNEVNRIDGMVTRLLDFAKPIPSQRRKTDIRPVINAPLDLLSNELIKHRINLQRDFEVPPEKALLNIDVNQIQQALLNILLNAIDAMPNGGTLTVSISPLSSSVLISVQDTGSGIAPEDIPHIFDPFFTKKDSGTGLGLAITQQIIQEHKGKLRVESILNQGTKFEIELPIENS